MLQQFQARYEAGSKFLRFNSADVRKVIRGGLIVGLGAFLATIHQVVTEPEISKDLLVRAGVWAPALTAVYSVLVNAVRRWLQDNSSDSI